MWRSWVSGVRVMRRRSSTGHGECVLFALCVKFVLLLLHKSGRLQWNCAVVHFLWTNKLRPSIMYYLLDFMHLFTRKCLQLSGDMRQTDELTTIWATADEVEWTWNIDWTVVLTIKEQCVKMTICSKQTGHGSYGSEIYANIFYNQSSKFK